MDSHDKLTIFILRIKLHLKFQLILDEVMLLMLGAKN